MQISQLILLKVYSNILDDIIESKKTILKIQLTLDSQVLLAVNVCVCWGAPGVWVVGRSSAQLSVTGPVSVSVVQFSVGTSPVGTLYSLTAGAISLAACSSFSALKKKKNHQFENKQIKKYFLLNVFSEKIKPLYYHK